MKYNFHHSTVIKVGICMDGGSIVIFLTHPDHGEIIIYLMQHIICQYNEEIDKLPGRIYINNNLIPKRSDTEFQIIEFLKKEMNANLTDVVEILQQKLDWIESDKYITFNPIKKELLAAKRNALKD
jgi:hypothetical protein